MNLIVIILLVSALILVLATLAGGLITMARGGELGPKKSNLFMRYRVLFQGIAVFILTILPDPWANWKNLLPPPNASYFKNSSSMTECQSALGYALGASQRGRTHAHDGLFREDDYHVNLHDHFVVIAVGDGAGSHLYSREGSRIATSESANMLSTIIKEQYDQIQKFLSEENSIGLNQFYKTSLVKAAYQAWYELRERRRRVTRGRGESGRERRRRCVE